MMKKKIPFDLILSITSNYYEISEQEILQKGREEPACLIRQICQYLAYTLNNQQGFYTSLSEVGNYFGGRKKGAVINSKKRIIELMQVDKLLRASIDYIIELIRDAMKPPLIMQEIKCIEKRKAEVSKQCWGCCGKIERFTKYINHEFIYNQKIITLSFHIQCYEKYER